MIALILSDTHDNLEAVDLVVKKVKEVNADVMIHAGDYIAPFTLRRILKAKIPLYGVFGNNDGDIELLLNIARENNATIRKQPLELELAGRKILVLHGFNTPKLTRKIVEAIAAKGIYDVVIYGHTHSVDCRKLGKTLIINPGEVCGYLSGKRTLILLDLEKLTYEILEL